MGASVRVVEVVASSSRHFKEQRAKGCRLLLPNASSSLLSQARACRPLPCPTGAALPLGASPPRRRCVLGDLQCSSARFFFCSDRVGAAC